MDARELARAEETLELAVFQTAYDPQQIQESMQRVQTALRLDRDERLRDARLMARVASYTEPDDDDGTAFPGVGAQKPQFRGVADPWSK